MVRFWAFAQNIMLTIQPALAQEIVSRTMGVIPFNVNVMDVRGIILGSGVSARIGQLHAGAQLVLAQQKVIEIDEAAVRHMPGVKPGVNLPLSVRGQICGVVGLTGAPRTVRQYGELVRITAEMILEQSLLTEELQREKRYREEFVYQALKPGLSNREEMTSWALRLGIEPDITRAAIVCEMSDPELSLDKAQRIIEQWQAALLAQRPEALVAAISPRELAILIRFDGEQEAHKLAAYARVRLEHIDVLVSEGQAIRPQLALGVGLRGVEGMALSYQSARNTLRVGRKRTPCDRLFSFYELSLPVLLAGVGSGWQAEHLRRPLIALAKADRRGGLLRRTLEAWFAANAQPQVAARALHVHRNTLDYRLRRIHEITGLNPAQDEERMMLYLALELE